MPSLELIPNKAVLQIQAGDISASIGGALREPKDDDLVFEPTFSQILSYEVAPNYPGRQNVRLTSGEMFEELEGLVTLKRATAENTEEAVGILFYIPEINDPSYTALCELPAQQFDELLSAARMGRLPSGISIDVVGEGAEVGWEPDGSGFEWDNKEHKVVTISHIRFKLAYVLPSEPDELQYSSADTTNTAPASQMQLERLLAITVALRKDVRSLAWIVMIAALFLASVSGNWF